MTSTRIFALLIAILIIKTDFAQEISRSVKDLQTTGTETITFNSEINKKSYKLYVNLPSSYSSDRTKRYPVFYKLDGQWSFTSVVSSYHAIRYDGFVPEIIIVGISYGGENPKYDSLRATDFTPTPFEYLPNSGQAETFQQVLSDEILSIIDKTYRTDGENRALAGTSLGGLFTHYSLFTKPELFNAYLITNPSFWWDTDYVYRLENEFANQNKTLNARVIYVSGEYDAVANITKMVDQIKAHNYTNLEMEMRVLEGMGHAGSKAEAHARALNFIYKRPSIKLPKSELNQYIGKYNLSWGGPVEINIADGELTLKDSFGNPPRKIQAINDSTFSFLGSYHNSYFTRDEQNKINGFVWFYNEWDSITGTKVE